MYRQPGSCVAVAPVVAPGVPGLEIGTVMPYKFGIIGNGAPGCTTPGNVGAAPPYVWKKS